MFSIELLLGAGSIVAALYVAGQRLLNDTYKILTFLTEIKDATDDNAKRLDSIDRKLERQDNVQDRTNDRLNDIENRLTRIETNCFAYHEQIQRASQKTDS